MQSAGRVSAGSAAATARVTAAKLRRVHQSGVSLGRPSDLNQHAAAGLSAAGEQFAAIGRASLAV